MKLNRKSVITVNEFLEQYKDTIDSDVQKLFELDFQLKKNRNSQKIKTTLHKAEPVDAEILSLLFKEVYRGAYPYKRMESEEALRLMINDKNHDWLIFKSNSKDIVGCFGADLDFNNKKGILYGFLIRKSYQNIVDSLKAFVGSLIYFWYNYKDKILIWSGEVRTNDSTAQFATALCGLKPIAFLPNKDIFFNRVESDFMIVCYDRHVLNNYRSKETPKIIRQVLNCFTYTNERYKLGLPYIENPDINLNEIEINKIKNEIDIKIEVEDFGYKKITFSIKNSSSYFIFYYNLYSKHFENTIYKINKLEELHVFLSELKELIQKMDINYFQCFVSAYAPIHQKIFYEKGFSPRGYVPCWRYNEKQEIYEDQILFNYFKGSFVKNIRLIPETEKLLQSIKFYEEELFPETQK